MNQAMVLLHHEVEIEFPDGRPTEKHQASLLEFGRIKNGKTNRDMPVIVVLNSQFFHFLISFLFDLC